MFTETDMERFAAEAWGKLGVAVVERGFLLCLV
jgi:hypothetical protein